MFFQLSRRQSPLLVPDTLDTLLLHRDQVLPVLEKVEVSRRQMTDLLSVQLGNRVPGARLDPIDCLEMAASKDCKTHSQ